ncbi:MAG: Cytochrome bb3 quinol oxidase subunit 1 apoprotein [Gammaproteobacteria bacterium]|nr:Cytochrome bb3 quinol oxidase subunit 1 apoprotein [Gammaproteobacteria bacterium]
MLGKLSWSAIPFNQPIPMAASLLVIVGILATLAWITVKRHWPYLWNEWITSVDHKRVGVMYCALALVMLIRGFTDAIMMRSQQALAFHAAGYLPPEHYDQIFSAHGTIMIFFVAMTFMIGLMNFVVPLQLGARDVAFPTLNSVSLWLNAAAVLLVNMSLVIGEFGKAGWLSFPPLSELKYSPGVGIDYYLWALQISGIGTLLTGVNFVTTILKIRAPGMTLTRMPIFCWTALASSLLMVAAFPILTATFAMLLLDRYLDFHFFTAAGGGNSMMYMNLIWAWGHPEVYILILPAFGVFSEVISTFSGKPLFGYRSMIMATMAICILSFTVWLHHFFTMGAGADVNGFFGIMSMVIAVPTGVKIFNWLFTLWGGRVRFEPPMMWAVSFMITFVVGGMTGVLLAVPPADFVLHNSLFLVAHFHNVIIGGVLFGAFAGYTYWFPKAFGFKLDRRTGFAAFWCWTIGFYVAFLPLYILGLEGMTRRMHHYDVAAWHPWLLVAALGALIILVGIGFQIAQLVISIRNRDKLRDLTGDPWDGRTLEWSTLSPPPHFNFAVMPSITGVEAYWGIKQKAIEQRRLSDLPDYKPVEMPRNSPTGFVVAFFAVVTGFALIWHIWWMVIIGLAGAFGTFVVFAWRDRSEYELSAAELARIDDTRRQARIGIVEGREPGITPVKHPEADGEDPNRLGARAEPDGGYKGPPSKRIITAYGFWIFLLSDFILFSGFYATYAVLSHATVGGPTATTLFNVRTLALETAFLLLSSFSCGMATLASNVRNMRWTQISYFITGLLGLGFLTIEVSEFAKMLASGAGPDRSAFLSSFFALVGLHGLHVAIGLLWLATMMAQIWAKGFRADIMRRGICFALFWHALDIIWVGIFTNVYLLGVSP